MDDRLKELMQQLANAINGSLSDSDRIAATIGDIKRAGYDVFLVLEATIGVNKRDENARDEEDVTPPSQIKTSDTPRKLPKIALTSQDQKFLRALKIDPNIDPKQS